MAIATCNITGSEPAQHLLEMGERQTRFTAGKTSEELMAWRNDIGDRYERASWRYELSNHADGDVGDELEAAREEMWSIEYEAMEAGFTLSDLGAWQREDGDGEAMPF